MKLKVRGMAGRARPGLSHIERSPLLAPVLELEGGRESQHNYAVRFRAGRSDLDLELSGHKSDGGIKRVIGGVRLYKFWLTEIMSVTMRHVHLNSILHKHLWSRIFCSPHSRPLQQTLVDAP